MKKLTGMLVILGLMSAPAAFAEKPAWAGKDKAAKEQMKSQRDAAQSDVYGEAKKEREKAEEKLKKARTEKQEKDKKEKHQDDAEEASVKGLDKQRESKSREMQKEAGKGSEQGQASREEHSRKWWKFWDE